MSEGVSDSETHSSILLWPTVGEEKVVMSCPFYLSVYLLGKNTHLLAKPATCVCIIGLIVRVGWFLALDYAQSVSHFLRGCHG